MVRFSLLFILASAGCTPGSTETGDSGQPIHNPRNPDGMGPATVLDDNGSDDPADLASYALLSKTGITNVTGSMISDGHMGVSPAAASYITGFAMVADSSNQFATSPFLVPPAKIYAADYAMPTPSDLTTVVSAMEAAYTDAASRNPPDELNLSDGNLGGLTLAPGLYTWGSSVTIPADVTFSGGADDVWILQIAGDLDLGAAQAVNLSGGAHAKNIFWQVTGSTTIAANAHFEGILVSQTAITFQTNASFNGRALAQSMVALDDNIITAP